MRSIHNLSFFFQAEDGIRDADVTGVQTCALPITLFLVQNGVLPARKGSKHSAMMTKLIKSKVKVLADRFSAKERAIRTLVDGVELIDINQLVDLLLEPGTKAIWH